MTKKQIADDFYFGLENEVSSDEPIIYEMDGPHAPFAQAIIGTEGEYCVEIAGPQFLKSPLIDEQTALLKAMGWHMPIDEYMPNFWRDYPKGTRKCLIASDVADALTKVFKSQNILTLMPNSYAGAATIKSAIQELNEATKWVFFRPE